MMSALKPPFELYRATDIADANGHICTAENPEIAQAILVALNGGDWRTDIENAPKDGRTVLFPLDITARAFWCNDLKRWVLDRPLHLESIVEPKRFRLERVPQIVNHGGCNDQQERTSPASRSE